MERSIITLTGASGTGKSTIMDTLSEKIEKTSLNNELILGDGFHAYKSSDMKKMPNLTHYSDLANEIKALSDLFQNFKENGDGKTRYYAHNQQESVNFNTEIGDFSAWKNLPKNVQVLIYEGLHGNMDSMRDFISLSLALQPEGHLHWLQFFWREINERKKDVFATIDRWVSRKNDYKKVILPQIENSNVRISSEFRDPSFSKDFIKGQRLPKKFLDNDIASFVNDENIQTRVILENKPKLIESVGNEFSKNIIKDSGATLELLLESSAEVQKLIIHCLDLEMSDLISKR